MRLPIKKERIFRTIIEKRDFTFNEIVKNTNLSKSFVSKVFGELAEKNLIVRTNNTYKMIDEEMLLKEWALIKRKIFNSLKPLKIFLFLKTKIKELSKDYAISGSFAEYLINGQTKGEEIIVYTSGIKRDVKKYLSGKPNVLVFIYDEHIFSNCWKFKGWNLVSIPQLCADLLAQGIYGDVALNLFKRWLSDRERVG